MRKFAPLGRKWSRRGCSLLFASLIAPSAFGADVPANTFAKSPTQHATSRPVSFEDLFPYMGLRFALRAERQSVNNADDQQSNPFSFDAYSSDSAGDDAMPSNDVGPIQPQAVAADVTASPTEASAHSDAVVVPLRQSIVAKSPDEFQREPSQWDQQLDRPNSAAASREAPTDDPLQSIPSVLGIVDTNTERREQTPKVVPKSSAVVATPTHETNSISHDIARSIPKRQRQVVQRTDESVLPIGVRDPSQARSQVRRRSTASVHESIASQAREYINNGIQLAQRGAVYSARAQFIKVLRLVSQSLDVEAGTNDHSLALANGLRALEEAKQLRPSGSQVEGNISLPRILMAHRTPVLRGKDLSKVSAIEAVRAYHAYADLQLAEAGGRELVAADALFGLAKLQAHLNLDKGDSLRAGPVAMSYYQAALMTYPNHYLAANELGVMFARFGQLNDAREVLRFAASSSPDVADIWLNLARVHDRLGEQELAKLAIEEYQALQPGPRPSALASRVNVQWVEPESFGRDVAEQVVPSTPPARAAKAPDQRGWPFR